MPDITMCMNEGCPLHGECYRVQATPNPWRQSMAAFTYEIGPDGVKCEYFKKTTVVVAGEK